MRITIEMNVNGFQIRTGRRRSRILPPAEALLIAAQFITGQMPRFEDAEEVDPVDPAFEQEKQRVLEGLKE